MMGKKDEQLGQSYNSASRTLHKQLLLRLLQELGYDSCFQCGGKIETIRDLSLEHKVPWLDKPNAKELFWDLDNLAWSHLSCNSGAARRNVIAANANIKLAHEWGRNNPDLVREKNRRIASLGGKARWSK